MATNCAEDSAFTDENAIYERLLLKGFGKPLVPCDRCQLLVASSDCSRCSRTLVGFRKVVSEKRAKATSNQRLWSCKRTRKTC